MRALVFVAPAVAVIGLGAIAAAAQERQGRFSMSPAENGFVRLDTETGAMSLCARRDARWVCEPMHDEAQALRDENERLRVENERLRARAQQAIPGPGDRRYAERRSPKLELPTEEDVDKALDYIERMYRKFRDRFKELEREERKGTPL